MNAVAADRLPGVLGHELRNPLASAVTGASLLREMIDGDDPRAPLVDGLLRDLDRMAALTDGWLQLARGRRAAAVAFDLAEVLSGVAARHGAELVTCPAPALVRGDRALLERAFDNLCENARNAGARSIRLAAQHLGADLCVHVEDDGGGVPPQLVEHIFAPGISSRGGTGLGLHAVAVTVAAHRGTVRCVPLTRGTRFTVTLPQGQQHAVPA